MPFRTHRATFAALFLATTGFLAGQPAGAAPSGPTGRGGAVRPDSAIAAPPDSTPPTALVLSPNSTQVWAMGVLKKITWKATDNVGVVAVDLAFSPDSGTTWVSIAWGLPNAGSYEWKVANVFTTRALVQVTARDAQGNVGRDVSNAVFEIRDRLAPTMAVTTPNGGQVWGTGTPHKVTWKATDNVAVVRVDLSYSANGGAAWTTIASGLANTGSLMWNVPNNVVTTTALFKAAAKDSAGNASSDVSNAFFEIRDLTPPAVTVTTPNGGQVWDIGTPHKVTWKATDNIRVSAIDLSYSPDSGSTWIPIVTDLANTGSYTWNVPTLPARAALLRATARDSMGNRGSDEGNAPFTIRDTAPPTPPRSIARILTLRADSASGSGPYPAPGADPVWVDVVGSHDGKLSVFDGTPASGWAGDGTPGNPHRLEFAGEEPGWDNHVAIPSGSVPELQTVGPVSAAVWFRTGYNGASSRFEYVVEWVQQPAPDLDPETEGRGMSIVVQDGKIKIYSNPWIDVCPIEPGRWYHVAVAKDTNNVRVYVNGLLKYAGTKSHRGIQQSEIALGASIFRRFEGLDGEAAFSDFFTGAIGRFDLWKGALNDAEVRDAFRGDSARYLAPGAPAPDSAVVRLEAARANGTGPHPSPGAASPWSDLAGPPNDFELVGFDGTAGSGWIGDGSAAAPYALRLDGIDDAASVSAANLSGLLSAGGYTMKLDFKTGSDVSHEAGSYLVEWLQGQNASPGMSVAIWEGRLRLYAGALEWIDLGPVAPETWYRLAVAKGPGDVRAYVDGTQTHSGTAPNLGAPNSGIVLGASTWRGPGSFGDWFEGSIASFTLWARTLSAAEIAGSSLRSAANVPEATPSVAVRHTFGLSGARPNPARGPMLVHFSLASSDPASLEVLDLSGRRMAVREVGSLGPGTHHVSLGTGRDLPSGVYWLRLRQGPRTLLSKAIVLE